MSLNEIVSFLDAHNGAVIAVATVAYVVITLLLLGEARAGRTVHDVANLEAFPRPWGPFYVALDLENYGPAVAKNVRLRFWIVQSGSTIEGTERVHVEPLFPVGRRRRFLISATDTKIESLHELSDRGATLRGEWNWEDGRRRFWVARVSHHKSFSHEFSELRDGFYGGHALMEREPAESSDRTYEEIKKLRAGVEKIAKTIEGPAMKVWIRQLLDDRQAQSDASGPAESRGPETPGSSSPD